MSEVRVAVVGYGYWGPNLVRNFLECPLSTVKTVCDINPHQLKRVGRKFATVETTSDYAGLLSDPTIDAIAVATPVHAHHKLAKAALEAGKHVFVEKPIASTSEQAVDLIETAERLNKVLMVDHTFLYTGAVRKAKQLVNCGELGDVYYYDSVRVNLGLFQNDVDVMWDLAVHDLTIMDFVLEQHPISVSATGIAHVPGKPNNIAYLTLFFESNLIAHVHVNWLSPVKVRRTLIGGSNKMVVYDDLEPSEKIKVYDKGVDFDNSMENRHKILISYRTGDAVLPHLDLTEALATEVAHFCDCITKGTRPISDGKAGLRTVKVLEAATESIRLQGAPVKTD